MKSSPTTIIAVLFAAVLCLNARAAQKTMLITLGNYSRQSANLAQKLATLNPQSTAIQLGEDTESTVIEQLKNGGYEQVWVFDLSSYENKHDAAWRAVADWFQAQPKKNVICDARILSSFYDEIKSEGDKLAENYYQNLEKRGGGLVLGTDHNHFQDGINTVNQLIGLQPFTGKFELEMIPVDISHPLMLSPNNMGPELHDFTTPGQAPYGIQPNGMDLFTVAWHSSNHSTPGISASFDNSPLPPGAEITEPTEGAVFPAGAMVSFKAATTSDNPPVIVKWESNIDGEISHEPEFAIDSLSPGNHQITLTAEDVNGSTGESVSIIIE